MLSFRRVQDVETALARYYPLERYPAKARYVLEELLPADTAGDCRPPDPR